MVALAIGASTAISAGASAIGGSSAAGAQTSAAGKATAAQQAMYNQGLDWEHQIYQDSEDRLQPWVATGQQAETMLGNFISTAGTTPFSMTQDQLEQTPGYQFNLAQGEKAVTNSNAARGLGTSGNALKEAATYASGLAQNTYGQQYAMYQDNLNQIYNRLMGVSTGGQNAATSVGNTGAGLATSAMSGGVQTGQNIGNNMIGAGNAQAAAIMGPTNAISGGANSAGQYAMTNQLIKGMYGSNNNGGPSGPEEAA